jgi:hypothetical protein
MINRVKEDWHLDKSVSVGHILTTITLVAMAVGAFYSLSTRLAVVEDRILTILDNQTRIDSAQDTALLQFRSDMRDMTVDLNAKLDTIMTHLLDE